MTLTCTRKLTFDAGHRLLNHGGKCCHLHGHTYLVELTAGLLKGSLDDVGRIVDFSVLKSIYNTWLEEHWDHGFLLNAKDTVFIQAIQNMPVGDGKNTQVQKLYLLDDNPTAENLAKFLGTHDYFVQALALHHVEIVRVVVHETPNCKAEWMRDSYV